MKHLPRSLSTSRRPGLVAALALWTLPALALAAGAAAPSVPVAPPPAQVPAEVMVVRIKSDIQPVVAGFVADTIAEADKKNAAALVIELDTPGGLLSSTRDITTAMRGAKTPIVVYVGPSGARAASAGFFILMAADVAAMAPGTNTGAAHPVGGHGEDIDGVMGKKAEEDAAANIRALAQSTGRNVDLAQKAVVESRSYSAGEALEGKLVEVVAPSLPALLQAIDGKVIQRGAMTLTLHTGKSDIRQVEMSSATRFLGVLADPNLAYILLGFGMLGLLIEITHPGAILPGVLGGMCLILAFFALSVLPVDYTGVALILLAAIFFILEIKVTSYGMLTVAGVICLIIGSLMLYKSPEPALRVSLWLVAILSAFALAVVGFLSFMALRAKQAPVRTGSEGLLSEIGTARTALDPNGKVFVHGEIWRATADGPVAAGEEVEVVAVENLLLRVRPRGGRATIPVPEG